LETIKTESCDNWKYLLRVHFIDSLKIRSNSHSVVRVKVKIPDARPLPLVLGPQGRPVGMVARSKPPVGPVSVKLTVQDRSEKSSD
jgi:hypothetical protein